MLSILSVLLSLIKPFYDFYVQTTPVITSPGLQIGQFNSQPSVCKQMKNLFGSGTGVLWGGPSEVMFSAGDSKIASRDEAGQSLRKARNERPFPIKAL